MENLSQKKCVPCKVGSLPLSGDELKAFSDQLGSEWKLIDQHHLEKIFTFKNFKDGLTFVQDVGHLAEDESHHPELTLSWGRVNIKIYTHKVDGLTESDFILAAKCDAAHIGRFG